MADHQLRREDLSGLSPEAIAAAFKAGALADVLAGVERPPEPRGIDPAEFEAAIAEGKGDEYLSSVEAQRTVAKDAAADARVASADQGARSTYYPMTESGQRARLATMSPAEVRAAWRRGEFDSWIAGELP